MLNIKIISYENKKEIGIKRGPFSTMIYYFSITILFLKKLLLWNKLILVPIT